MATTEEVRLTLNPDDFKRGVDQAQQRFSGFSGSILKQTSALNERISKFGQILTGFGVVTVLQQAAGQIGRISDAVDAFNRKMEARAVAQAGGGRPGSRSAGLLAQADAIEAKVPGRTGQYFSNLWETLKFIGEGNAGIGSAELQRRIDANSEARDSALALAKELRDLATRVSEGERQVRDVGGPRAIQQLGETGLPADVIAQFRASLDKFSNTREVDQEVKRLLIQFLKQQGVAQAGPAFDVLPMGQ